MSDRVSNPLPANDSPPSIAAVPQTSLADRHDWERFRRFEDEFIANQPNDWAANRRRHQALVDWAIKLGVFPRADPMDGLETVLRIAKLCKRV